MKYCIIVVFLLAGCASLQSAAGVGLRASSGAIEVSSKVIAQEYTEAAERALQEAESEAEYRIAMGAWEEVLAAVRAAKGAWSIAHTAYETWLQTDDSTSFLNAAKCLLLSLSELETKLAKFGIGIPSMLKQAIGIAADLPLGVCGA